MLELVEDRPASEADPVLMRGYNAAAVSWVSRCDGARDKRAGLSPMRMLGRLEIKRRWSHIAKHVPGVQNILADGISRWPHDVFGRKVRELTNSDDWSEQEIGKRGVDIFKVVPRTKSFANRRDELLWNLMENGTDGTCIAGTFTRIGTLRLHSVPPTPSSCYLLRIREQGGALA